MAADGAAFHPITACIPIAVRMMGSVGKRAFAVAIAALVMEAAGALLSPSVPRHHSIRLCSRRGGWCEQSVGFVPSFPRHRHRLNSLAGSGERSSRAPSEQEQTYWKLPRLYVGPRCNVSNNPLLAAGAIVPLSPDQTHYLTNVMRILKKRKSRKVTDTADDGIDTRECIRVFNGKDGEWLAKVHASEEEDESTTGNSKKRKRPKQNKDISLNAECILQLRAQESNDDDRPWILFAPLKKQPRMKNMIEKCTELGVGRLIPLASDRTEGGALAALIGSNTNIDANIDLLFGGSGSSRESGGGLDKLEVQAIEAAEQCERLGVPVITKELASVQHATSSDDYLRKVCDAVEHWCHDKDEGQGLDDRTSSVSNERVLLICRERGEGDSSNRVVPILQALRDTKRVAFLVGPEGGWSMDEEESFDEICSRYSEQDTAPVRCVSLGSTVLRAETACMMAVGAWALSNYSQ